MAKHKLVEAQKIIRKYNLYKLQYNNCSFKDEAKWDLKVIDFRMKGKKLFEDIKENGCSDCPTSILCNNCVETKKILSEVFYREEEFAKRSKNDGE